MSFGAMAQLEVKPDSFKLVEGFVNINPDKQYDDNNQPYSLLKIRTENISDKQRRQLVFQGDAATFFEVEYNVGEVWLYISHYASFIKISHPDLSSTEFWFPYDMKPKCGYELTLVNKANTTDDEILERLKKLEEANQAQANQAQPEQKTLNTEKPRTPLFTFFTLNASVNTYSQPAFGFTIGTMRKFGVFLSFMSNFRLTNLGKEGSFEHHNSEYLQNLIDENGYDSYTEYTSISVIFGFAFKIYKNLSMKVGGGYGNNSLWLTTTEPYSVHNTYWVSDVSAYGFGGLAGVQYRLKNFVFTLDGATTNFKIFETRIGIGYGFGKKQ